MNYENLAKQILKNVGGQENVSNLTHCATRLRFNLKDLSKANTEAIKKTKGVMGLMSVVAGTTDERDIGNVMKELPVTDEIKNGLLGADGLFGDVFRLVVDYEHANWDKVEEFVKKYNVDAQQLANEYVQCVRFMQQFYIG